MEEKFYLLLKDNSMSINEITTKLKEKQEDIIFVVRKLLDEKKIFQNAMLKLEVAEK